ncbi:polymorphic toxin type 50 domain-containing protein [Clostridium sp. AM49-4BH]|uniref:polymorphic toxin type 50 domain-containing protein n=1 Tax=Clostridium sp. AM49-4BH TaxID=2293035 RepID=UPI000E53D689|nr:polymorphic toxin type 50 domain-containing protein [Clostridium sp. AM49-4BH]RHQ09927.1 hypothetical protein DW981_12430 [Clostridium sp. AM49-4BH]
MGLTNFDELNTLSTTETTKDDRHKATRKKIPIHDYFENMQISEEEKEKRVRLANLLLADVLFLFALSKRNQDKQYLSEAFQKRYLSSVQKVAEPDQKMQRYIRKVCDSIVDTTLKGGSLTTRKANKPQDPYAVSVDRATNVAENEANAILNGDEYITAVKNGCTKKRWKSYRDERVRADHADVDGQVVDISRPFRVGKYVMMYPKDDSLGAGLEEIVNCRCSVEYLKSDDRLNKFKQELSDGIINTNIKWQKQREHITGTKENERRIKNDIENQKTPCSMFYDTISVKELLSQHVGTGVIKFTKGSVYPKEYIRLDVPIGIVYNVGKNMYQKTCKMVVVYSKKGIHAYPVKDW